MTGSLHSPWPAEESHWISFLVSLVLFWPVYFWWPWWLNPSMDHNPLMHLLASDNMSILACSLSWAFNLSSEFSMQCRHFNHSQCRSLLVSSFFLEPVSLRHFLGSLSKCHVLWSERVPQVNKCWYIQFYFWLFWSRFLSPVLLVGAI